MTSVIQQQKISYLSYSVMLGMLCISSSVWAEEAIIQPSITPEMSQNPQPQVTDTATGNVSSPQNLPIAHDKNILNDSNIASTANLSKNGTVEQQAQAILQSQPKVEPLTFENLEQYQVDVDLSMVNEIYQVAEQAKKDAEIWQTTGNTVSKEKVVIDNPLPEMEKIDINTIQPQTNVNQLIADIEQDSQEIVNQVKNKTIDTTADGVFIDKFDQIVEDDSQLSWWQRWKNKRQQPELKKAKYIKVEVQNVESTTLSNNLKAKLETLTIDNIQDFSLILPQLRKLATQASQAVGYYDAEFSFSKHDDGQRVTVKMTKPVNPVIVQNQDIVFTGAGQSLPQFQVIKIVPDLDVGDILNHGLYEATKERINEAASSNGFFDGSWTLHDVKVTLPEDTADIHLKYDTGERYQFGDVQFRMSDPSKPLPIDERILREMLTWKQGDDYVQWRLNTFSNYLTNSRFFNAVTVNAMIPDPIEKQLDLPPDILKKLEQQGDMNNTPISDVPNVDETQFAGVANDDVNVEENIESDSVILNAEQQQVQQNQQEEQLLKQQARDTKQIPVVVTLNADKLNNVEFGFGYGTDTKFRTRMQYRRAIVNHLGHSLQANLELSQIRQAGEMRYYIPHYHPINRYWTLIGGYERESDQTLGQGLELVTETAVGGGEFSIRGQQFDMWKHDFGVRYRLDRLTVRGDVALQNIPHEFLIVRTDGEQESFLVSYGASKIYANSATNITKGFRQSYKLQLGSKNLLNDTDLAILSAGMGFIYSLGKNSNHQFVGRADTSYIFTNDFSKVPYNLRLFAGGDQSIRGFDYKALSPMINGLKIGGQALAVGSLEYNYQVVDGWRVGVFSDFGNAFNAQFNNPMAYSVGLGVRWQSPIGPIRVDVATGLSDDNHPVRVHFFIGSPLQ